MGKNRSAMGCEKFYSSKLVPGEAEDVNSLETSSE